MKEIQKYVVLMIMLAILESVFPFLREIYLAHEYGASEIPLVVKANWAKITSLFYLLQNVVAAMWLWVVTKNDEVNRLIWLMFGLLFGLLGVGIYYLVRINEKLKHNKSFQPTANASAE